MLKTVDAVDDVAGIRKLSGFVSTVRMLFELDQPVKLAPLLKLTELNGN